VTAHPTGSELEQFLDGSLPRERTRFVLIHLLRGCEACQGAIGPKATSLFRAGVEGEDLSRLRPEDLAAFLPALDRAVPPRSRRAPRRHLRRPSARLALRGEKGGAPLPAGSPGAYPVYEALLARSWSFRQDSPRKMVEYAWYATRAAACLRQEGLTPEEATDLEARALGELANAYRVASRLEEAEQTLGEAVELARQGTGDPFLTLRLSELRASLLAARHRYPEAVELLDRLAEELLGREEHHAAGRVRISQGVFTGYLGGSPQAVDEALRLIDLGLGLVDPEREPPLGAAACLERIDLLLGDGRLERAQAELAAGRETLLASGRRLDRARVVSLEGRIQAGLGCLQLAEGALREARDTFEDLDVKGPWALACLDLGMALAGLGRSGEARGLAEEALWVFRHLRIGFGVLDALCILDDVLQSDLLSAGFLERLAKFVRRAEHEPAARFDPGF
jgi:tetratricopeptide (TPR) repeat protein